MAELVGGALLSAFLQVAFDRLASPQFVDFFRGRKLDEKLLGNLNIMLHSINALADDAEQKQFTDPHVKAWLLSVKEAVFDAEDLLGEIDYELTRCQVEAGSEPQTFTDKVSTFFNSTFSSFNKKIESEMREVLEKLEYLAKQKGALGLKEGIYSGDSSGSKVSQKLPSSSLVVETVIYGRDVDKEIIFNWLTSETGNHNHPSVLSIVGMGGLGKTTLAQHVYNDTKLEEAKFDITAWVCVSDHFNVLTVTKTILEAVTKSKDDSGDLQMVHERLKEKISGKKFFLVLDDVWNERQEKWEAVQTPLSYGAPGSRILVTTRGEKVASIMRSKVHRLKQLKKDICWNVFEKHALRDDELELNDEKKEIGRRIVQKCKGLPLALKTIGSLLRTKSSISDWQSVLESDIWDLPKEVEIMPALLLSYQHLPSHLKRCFAYCALFPKDYKFDKKELILLWIAQDFLHCSQQSNNLEEIGEQYFNDLLMRSFFLQSDFKTCFFMHDLLNDLAKYVCADFCFRLKFDKGNCISKTTRHFSFGISDVKYFDGLGSLTDAKRLRSFFPYKEFGRRYIDYYPLQFKILVHELFSNFKFLRVLSLDQYSELREVPDSIGDLKHLHSLDLSGTQIQKLPDSTCLLYNLLILKLNYCSSLKELPLNLHKLTKLRCLEFENTNVTEMPMHFGELKNLQVLSAVFVDKNKEFSTKHLGGLNLHGGLSINEVQNIVNPVDALEANLKNKDLVKLELKWKSDYIPDDPRKEKKVLENLQPSKTLEHLSIKSYGGTEFPSWVFDNSLSNLVSLRLEDCKYCLCLPPLGLLSSLKTLQIIGFDGIVSIGDEFYGNSSSSFTSLERLTFSNMKELEECERKTAAFPRLEFLSVYQCPKLKGLPKELVNVKYLDIRGSMKAWCLERCEHTVSHNSLEDLNFCAFPIMNIPMSRSFDLLEQINIFRGCDSLTTFPLDFFPNLKALSLYFCRNLQIISQDHTHNHLESLTIDGCSRFDSFPSEGLSAPRLKRIDIDEAENLKLLPKQMQILLPSLNILKIICCPKVEMFPNGGLPPNVKAVFLSSLKLMASLRETLGTNTCLQSLYIEKMDVEFFPDEVLLPHSITALRICDCPNLKKMEYKGLCHLSSLLLHNCPNLQCLPEDGLPKSISSLQILNCPLLKQRCQNPEGQDWNKIAHIEDLIILP
ncbi:putative disease resistance protein At3g14460 [Vigna unguiculata]|uniref:putative disease resistance protein At3g14460 n=1 Tax=Vigna unguiculata TaxID=3917 RepID=UPI00101694DA|nr:putative disease resistance protein At3g14460 [Vigna unguiculata]XP_027925352.1 putative disease resistance protein At3g14460 [Vigna unguiculata]